MFITCWETWSGVSKGVPERIEKQMSSWIFYRAQSISNECVNNQVYPPWLCLSTNHPGNSWDLAMVMITFLLSHFGNLKSSMRYVRYFATPFLKLGEAGKGWNKCLCEMKSWLCWFKTFIIVSVNKVCQVDYVHLEDDIGYF